MKTYIVRNIRPVGTLGPDKIPVLADTIIGITTGADEAADAADTFKSLGTIGTFTCSMRDRELATRAELGWTRLIDASGAQVGPWTPGNPAFAGDFAFSKPGNFGWGPSPSDHAEDMATMPAYEAVKDAIARAIRQAQERS